MADEKPKKTSLADMVKQKLIGELLAASDAHKNAQGSVDSEALRKEQIEILGKYEEQTTGAEQIFKQLTVDAGAVAKFAAGGPRRLIELLVSSEPVAFGSLSDLDAKFGALPAGFGYRYLAPPTNVTPEADANTADNVIRLPSSFNVLLDEQFDLSGDEIPDRSLAEWLENQPAALYRLWSLRALSMMGILSREDVPAPLRGMAAAATSGSVPSAGKARAAQVPPIPRELPPAEKEEIDSFRALAVLQYDGESENIDSHARYGVADKFGVYARLKKIGPDAVLALGTLLHDEDIGVRVSAATYLLPAAPGVALPVLREAAQASPDDDDERVQRAAVHARQAIWMYEDGNLGF